MRTGLEHGVWCVTSGWLVMLLPMVLPVGHMAAMGLVTVLMFCERLDPPGLPTWRLRGFGTAWSVLRLKVSGPWTTPFYARPEP